MLKNMICKFSGFGYQIGSMPVAATIEKLVRDVRLPQIVRSQLPGYLGSEAGVHRFEEGTFTFYVDYLEWVVEVEGQEVFLMPYFARDYVAKGAWMPPLDSFRVRLGELNKEVVDAERAGLQEILKYKYYFKDELRPIYELF